MLWTFIVRVVNIINLKNEYSISCKLGLYIIVPTHKSPSHFVMHHHQIKDVITLDLMIHKDMQHHAW